MAAPPRPWLPMPSPIRRLFTAFPLKTFPPSPLPSSCPPPVAVPRLYIHSDTINPLLPSWDAECLKWQVNSSPLLTHTDYCVDFSQLRMGWMYFCTEFATFKSFGGITFLNPSSNSKNINTRNCSIT
jgi:hypothetical protein